MRPPSTETSVANGGNGRKVSRAVTGSARALRSATIPSYTFTPRDTNSEISERAMSPDALELELERLHAAACGWALACCAGDRAAAEDALQASYLKILDQSARFDGRASFRTRLFGVVRRTAAEQRRRAALRRLLPLAVLDAAPDGRPDPAAALARAEGTRDRKSTRLNSSHLVISYAVFCLKKKKTTCCTDA